MRCDNAEPSDVDSGHGKAFGAILLGFNGLVKAFDLAMMIPSLIFAPAIHKLAAVDNTMDTVVRIVRLMNCFSKTDSVDENDMDGSHVLPKVAN